MNKDKTGYIYILTNQSFPNYVKIGYADNVEKRVAQLNKTECTPFAFRIYATYKVDTRLSDIPLHQLIDSLNNSLRSIDNVDGKIRVREFYAMSPEQAYKILEFIAKINGLTDNLILHEKTKEAEEDEEIAETISLLNKNRHHFKDIEFFSPLTGKKYKGTTSEDGTLCIFDLDTNEEVHNNAKPNKKAIVGSALEAYGEEVDKNDTLYQRYHKLTKKILGK